MPASGRPIFSLDARLVQGTNTGDSSYWSGLLYGLARIEAEARFLLFSHLPKPTGLTLDDRFEWVCVPARSQRWWSLVQFPLAARRMGSHVIHTQYSLSPLAGRIGITTIHDVSFLIGPQWFTPKDRLILSWTVPASIKRAARVLAVSETCRKEIENFIVSARGKTVVTPNACPQWIQRIGREEASRRVLETLGIDRPFLLTVGTRWPRKNMQLAVDSASALPDRYPHRLVITGKPGWGEAGLGKRGHATGYVDTEMLSCLYSLADLYLAPSRHEGFGIPLLEAFRCGCPVVCSSGGALPEVAGDAAVVETSWNASDWSTTIAKLLDDPSKLAELKARGLDREKLYTWEQTAQTTLDVYREVAR